MAVFVCAGACVTETLPRVSPVYRVKVLGRWRVVDAQQQQVGTLVLHDVADHRWYRIETPGGAFVGESSLSGRFFRSEPFREDLRPLGLHPMKEGLRKLFDLEQRPEILPFGTDGSPTEAAAHRLLNEAMADRQK